MRSRLAFAIFPIALLWGCSNTVLVEVPPRVELKGYTTLGIIEFRSNSTAAVNARATRQFQEHIQAAQPGTRFVELGSREGVLAAVGRQQLDTDAVRKIGAKYGVAAVFVGDIAYSEPKADLKLNDFAKFDGAVRAEMRGDISGRLLETSSGASVWSNSAWVKKQLGTLSVSTERGVAAGVNTSDPRAEMVPGLVYHLTHDFRPSSVRQPAK